MDNKPQHTELDESWRSCAQRVRALAGTLEWTTIPIVVYTHSVTTSEDHND